MIRPTWLLWTFAAGIAVGAFATRAMYGTSSAAAPAVATESHAAPHAAPTDVERPAPAAPATPLSALSLPDATPRVDNPSSGPAPSLPIPGVTNEEGLQPIDAGPVFGKMLAKDAQIGQDQIRDAHRALERETRDEGWAYAMESELQGAMVNEVATGAFNADHIECRSTMCEVRLSGTTPLQGEAIKRWHESQIGRADVAFGQNLFPRHSSMVGANDRTDLLMIFVKPPPPGSTPEAPPAQEAQPVKKEVRRIARQEGAN